MRKYTIQGMRVNLAEEEENQESESIQAQHRCKGFIIHEQGKLSG